MRSLICIPGIFNALIGRFYHRAANLAKNNGQTSKLLTLNNTFDLTL